MPNPNRSDASDPIIYIYAHAADIAAGIGVRVGTIASDGTNYWLKYGSLPTDWTLLPYGVMQLPVATLTALGALVVTTLPNGITIYSLDVQDFYVLDKTGSHTVDGVTVIAASPSGYWVAYNHGRWEDVQGSVNEGSGVAALTTEVFRDTPFVMSFMRHDQDDILNFVFQFPHRWDYTLPVNPHMHVLPMVSPPSGKVVNFTGGYAWSRIDQTANPIPALTGWTPFNITLDIGTSDGFVQKIASIGAITPPAWARGSTCLLIYWRRYGTGPTDSYDTSKASGTQAANLGLLSVDVHYRVKDNGTITELPT